MQFSLSEVVGPTDTVRIVDVGAMDVGETAYDRLAQRTPHHVVGFEPVQRELEKLRRAARPNYTYLPNVVGDGSTQTFYECNAPMNSSLLEPDPEVAAHFQGLANIMRVTNKTRVQTTRLDDIPEVSETDFLKLDVQGGEAMVLKGAPRTLKRALVVQTEVWFAQLYRGQPLFGDIDALLRARGFLMHRYVGTTGRAFVPMIFNGNIHSPGTQLLWGDAVYVRDFRQFSSMSPPALMRLATILHEQYDSFDLAGLALHHSDLRNGTKFADAYLARLQRGP
jgi:FkbM family methyltransferase